MNCRWNILCKDLGSIALRRLRGEVSGGAIVNVAVFKKNCLIVESGQMVPFQLGHA